jgi:hypothetical protein
VLRHAPRSASARPDLLGALALIARNARALRRGARRRQELAELFPSQPEPAALVQDIENQRAGCRAVDAEPS